MFTTRVYLCVIVFSYVYKCKLVHVYLFLPMFTRVYLCLHLVLFQFFGTRTKMLIISII